jgi:phosphinothricin acetyltransferase
MSDDLERALVAMRDARNALLDAVAGLSDADLGRARPGGWSVRRVLEHVVESESAYAKLLAHLRGRAQPDAPRAAADVPAVLDSLAVTRADVHALVDGVEGETLYRLARVGHEEYSVLSVLQNIAAHDRDHLGQIADLLAPRVAQGPAPASPAGLHIRRATEADLERVNEIYNHYVRHTAITFDIEPFTLDERRAWFAQFAAGGPHRLLVGEFEGAVVAYAGTHRFRTKAAYDTTVETTVYCAPEMRGRGVGSALYGALFEAIREEDVRMAIAGITMPNDASVALHERFGFERAGLMHGVGRKFGRYWDVLWMEKRLRE